MLSLDPLIGTISDNFRSKLGRRHLFIYIFGLPAAVSYYFLWSPPSLDQDNLFIYFISLTILTRFLMTFYEVPSVALGPELSLDYDKRTKLSAARYLFGWWGGLTMATLVYLVFYLKKRGLNYLEGWSSYGLTASCLIIASIYCSGIGLHYEIPNLSQPPPQRKPVKQILIYTIDAITNRQFLALFSSASFFAMASWSYYESWNLFYSPFLGIKHSRDWHSAITFIPFCDSGINTSTKIFTKT